MSTQAHSGGARSSPRALERLIRPRSVAIVGASATPGALGAAAIGNLDRLGYGGDVHLVNPNRERIGERACLKSIDDLPLGVDAVVLAIPGPAVLDAMRALARRQAGAAVIFAAGFAEGGEAGRAEQRELAAIAAQAGMVVEGPNCLGLVNYVDGVALTFVETPAAPLGGRPGIGIVSQSGAMAAVLGVMLSARGLGLSYSISTGNEAVTGVEDYLEFMLADPGTRVIALIVEQFRQPRRFLEIAARARRQGKPVVLLHPGRSAAARESAATHTGAMAGDHAVMQTMVERQGVLLARTLEELGDVLEIAARCVDEPRGGTVVLTESGAFKALTLDLAEECGLPLPALSDANSPGLRAALPPFVPVSNPVDLTAQALVDPGLYRRTLAALLEDSRVGSVLFGIIQTDAATAQRKFPSIISAVRDFAPRKPVLFAGLDEGAEVPREYVQQLRELGVPYFASPERALRAMARFVTRVPDGGMVESLPTPLPVRPPPGVVPEHRAKELLRAIGVPFPAGGLATSLESARGIAARLGYPLALKAQSAALSHKSDAGGVILGVGDERQLAEGWTTLHSNLARHAPGLRLEGVLVERMGKPGLELIIGARNDPDWGPLILAGFGGVQAEILRDVRLLPANLGRPAIIAELLSLKSAALLRGFRGAPERDIAAVADLIARLGAMLLAEPSIRELDLNPVIVHPAGEGVIALDALMRVDD